MPVTARLSRKFYETFGDDIVTELVEWFNQVDATYHADLRELNELNFARFEAKLEQRFTQQDAKWEQRFAQQDAKWEQRLGALCTEIHADIHATRADLIKWMFLFWAGTALAGLLLR